MTSNSERLTQFFTQIEQEQQIPQKLRIAIAFMRQVLAQTEGSYLEDFWKARELCASLFKQLPVNAERTELWSEYLELSNQQRQLKELFDQESAFAVEQIELAVQSLENELGKLSELLAEPPLIQFSSSSKVFGGRQALYCELQGKLDLLNAFADRTHSLRQEILKTGMRARMKNQFLGRLSKCGDQVFPQRKELVHRLSAEFNADIEGFVQAFEQGIDAPFYVLREEIKALQAVAKRLSLTPSSFKQMRYKLSACWNKIKEQDHARKEEMVQRREQYKQNIDLVKQKIQELSHRCQTENLSLEILNQGIDAVASYMKSVDLRREEIGALREELFNLRRPLLEKKREQDLERVRKEQVLQEQKRARLTALKQMLETLISRAGSSALEELNEGCSRAAVELREIGADPSEKKIIEQLLKRLAAAICDQQERQLLNLPDDQRQALGQLKLLLQQRKERRRILKEQLETSRKELSISGLDFEKALGLQQQLEAEKALVDKAETAVREVEEQISEMRRKSSV